jgi:hypothetical protein
MKLLPTLSACVFFLTSLLLVMMPAHAASLYIDPGISTLNRGDSITMAIRLDTDEAKGECVNAVDGVLTYSSNIEPVDISIGDSIFNIWVEQPTINRENNTITFAGGIPNGYCGRIIGDPRLTNVLTEIVFRSPGFTIAAGGVDENKAVIAFSDETTAYLNDGRGTKATLATYAASIQLNSSAGSRMINEWKEEVSSDNIPPEKFSVSLHKDDKAFSQKYYIIFNTADKQTGIDQYQVMEEPLTQFGSFQWGRADAPWVKARSPYVLEDQSLNSIIRVKAIDKAGNEYISNLIPDESMRVISVTLLVTIGITSTGIILLLVIGLFTIRYVKRIIKNKRRFADDNDENIEIEPEI